jgi:hypothetical protein
MKVKVGEWMMAGLIPIWMCMANSDELTLIVHIGSHFPVEKRS